MNKSESAKCFNEQIRKRWPHWTPSDVEIADWLVWLGNYDYPTISTASRKHLAESRYAKPIPAQLLGHTRKAMPKPTPATKTKSSGVPEAHTYIMCTSKDERGKGRLGWFLPILIWPFGKSYTAEQYHRNAEAFAQKHADFYGGVWEVFTRTNHGEMLNRRMKLLNIKPLDLNHLRKRYKP